VRRTRQKKITKRSPNAALDISGRVTVHTSSKRTRELPMNNKKPTPVIQQRGGKECPVCHKPSYSRDGIHPQCAIEQADLPRRKRLAAEKKLQEKTKKAPKQKAAWNKKCPKCHVEVHVRLKVCKCGHPLVG